MVGNRGFIMKKKEKKFNFSSLVVILSIIHIDAFIVALYLLYKQGFMFSDAAITCFFTFWGVELLSLAGIKIGKAKYNKTYETVIDETLIDEEV